MKRIRTIVTLFFLTMLSGCGRIVNWHKDTFYQGCPVEQFSKNPQSYIRSLYLYDQLSTICLFDVLWLSDAVRTAYVSAHSLKTGKSAEARHNFLRRQLEENKHFITFYVLATTPNLEEKDAIWSFSLCVRDHLYTPVKIRSIDLNPEYISFFGRKYNRFRIVYEIQFNALTAEEKPILDSSVSEMTLHIRSLFKESTLTWRMPLKKGSVEI